MKKILLFACILVAAVTSCEKESNPVETETGVTSLKVSLPKYETKTSMSYGNDAYNIYWALGDVVSVGMNNLSNGYKGVVNAVNEHVFTFENPISDGEIVRYPASYNPTSLTIPSVQVSIAGLPAPDANPLAAFVSLNNMEDNVPAVQLKSLVSMMKFSVKGTGSIAKVTVEAVGAEPINGRFSMSKTGAITAGPNTDCYTEISFQQSLTLSEDKAIDIFVPINAATYSKGLSVKLLDQEKLMKLIVFKDGKQLNAQDTYEFNVVYSPGYQAEVTPDAAFDSSKLEDLPADEIQYEKYTVLGTIKYDDGQPAVGVRVSDGFTVVKTDENGKYRFLAKGKFVKYIYVSYPSDAKITVASDGCPEFFTKYKSDVNVYNFTFTRQPVENEFAIFAMADPQTHYKARDTQTKADTERYASETVPALNAEIAKQTLPCYGVSLGDITYSEGSRNSNTSMSIIKSNFAKVNMPIFNAMGNHDYTYYNTNADVSTAVSAYAGVSSPVNIMAQRSFEEVFGPINFSFDRGKVHFVCMKDIIFTTASKWDAGTYQTGFTDEEYQWLVQDLENTPKDMKVVLCVHIPISTATASKNHVQDVKNLLAKFTDSIIFSGHTHYQRTVYDGSRLYEHIHAAICGQWWWSNVEGDGCPNGYSVYHFNGTDIKDYYYIGVNDKMNTRDYQMRIYKGDMRTGGKYAYFQMPHNNTYLINVFNGDQKWTVKVYEDDVYAGQATLMPASKQTLTAGSNGTVHNISTSSSQDWWMIGYHIGVCKRGTSGTSYQTANYHMWKWVTKNPSAKISVEATDRLGNTYTCDEVITDGTSYPEYIKVPLNVK